MRKLIIFIIAITLGSTVTWAESGNYDNEIVFAEDSVQVRRTVQESSTGVNVTYNISKLYINKDETDASLNRILMDLFSEISENNKPSILKRTDFILIPENYDAEVSILDSSYVDVKLSLAPTIIRDWDQPATNSVITPYEGFYPVNSIESLPMQTFRSAKLQPVSVLPIKYDMENKTVRVYTKLKYRIDYVPANNTEKMPKLNLTKSDCNRLSNIVLNPSSLIEKARKEFSTSSSDIQYGYLIISHPEFSEAVNVLASNKRLMGYNIHVEMRDDWTPEKIKSTIHRTIDNDNWVDFLCIVGDINHVPSESIIAFEKTVPTDYYYTKLSPNESYFPDLKYGRISVSNSKDAYQTIKKLERYEFQMVPDYEFYSSATFGTQFELYNWWESASEKEDTMEFASRIENMALHIEQNFNKKINRFYWAREKSTPKYWFNGTELPEYLRAPNFYWDADSVKFADIINSGTNIFMTYAHGGDDGWGSPNIRTRHFNLLNNGDKLPFFINISCLTGNFSNIEMCMASALLNMPNGGAAGVIAASGSLGQEFSNIWCYALANTIWGTPTIISPFTNKEYFIEKPLSMGEILNVSTDAISHQPDFSLTNRKLCMLFGDPAIEFRREVPSLFYAPIVKIDQNQYKYKLLINWPYDVTAVDYYSGKSWTLQATDIIECENPGFTEVCIRHPETIPLKQIVDDTSDAMIRSSVNQDSSYSANRLLIGNAFYTDEVSSVVLSADKIDASVKELIVLPKTEISENCDFSIIID